MSRPPKSLTSRQGIFTQGKNEYTTDKANLSSFLSFPRLNMNSIRLFRNSSDKDIILHSLLVNINEAHKEPTALRDFY